MDKDESLTLKFQLIDVAQLFEKCLTRLDQDWSKAGDNLNNLFVNHYIDDDIGLNECDGEPEVH